MTWVHMMGADGILTKHTHKFPQQLLHPHPPPESILVTNLMASPRDHTSLSLVNNSLFPWEEQLRLTFHVFNQGNTCVNLRGYLRETRTNSDRYESFAAVYMKPG